MKVNFCSQCGTKITSETKYCGECGIKIKSQIPFKKKTYLLFNKRNLILAIVFICLVGYFFAGDMRLKILAKKEAQTFAETEVDRMAYINDEETPTNIKFDVDDITIKKNEKDYIADRFNLDGTISYRVEGEIREESVTMILFWNKGFKEFTLDGIVPREDEE